MTRQMNVAMRLGLGFGAVCLLLLVLAGVAAYSLRVLIKDMHFLITDRYPKVVPCSG